MKRIISFIAALLIITTMLAGCSKSYNFNMEDYLEIPSDLKLVKILQSEINEELKTQIKDILYDSLEPYYTVLEDKNAEIKKGHSVNIFYTGTPVGVEVSADTLKGMTNVPEKEEDKADAKGTDLVIGSESFIGKYESKDDKTLNRDGFEDQLIGHKAGETVTVNVRFPDDYKTKELQGVEANFEVVINSVSEATIDEKAYATISFVASLYTKPEADEASAAPTPTPTVTPNPTPTTTPSSSAKDFAKLFKSSSFTVDYTAEEIETTFCTVFNVKDIKDIFAGLHTFDTVTKILTVPETESEDYKSYIGKEIEFVFTVEDVEKLPEWNDEFVKEYTNETHETVAAYEEELVKSIENSLAYDKTYEMISVKKYPKKETEEQYNIYIENYIYEEYGDISDMTAKEFKKKITEEKYAEIYTAAIQAAAENVKSRMFVEYLIDKFDVSLGKKEAKELKANFEKNYYTYYTYYGIATYEELELQTLVSKALPLLKDAVDIVNDVEA